MEEVERLEAEELKREEEIENKKNQDKMATMNEEQK